MASNFAREAFEDAVEEAKRYVYEGDIFQVVLSQRFEMPFEGDRFNLYRALRQVNPSPYLFYLDFDDFALVGSSPEVLVRAEGDRAEVLPIAGTRPRGTTEAEDEALANELLADPKERAEHLMLVDLGRNDLGRVCRYDTVEVDRYAYIERYSHVMHIVSSVAGTLAAEQGPMDVLAACFPAGTVSGAPKVRAMEIIDELEPTRRGIYAGAVGYVDFTGTLDTCIAIRTMVVRDGTIYVQAGAGIVADSDPAKEYDETRNKAQALREAMLLAAEDLL
jgi:anthranilate synthase component 1